METIELMLEIVNAALGIAAIALTVGLLAAVRGGKLEAVWRDIGWAALFFGIFEILGFAAEMRVLKGTVDIGFAREILEFLAILMLVRALIKARKAFTV